MPWLDLDCVPEHDILTLQKKGQLCPRVDLLPVNGPAARLARWGMVQGVGDPAWQFLFNLTTDGWPPSERSALFLYLVQVLNSDPIREKISRDAERAKQEAKRQREIDRG